MNARKKLSISLLTIVMAVELCACGSAGTSTVSISTPSPTVKVASAATENTVVPTEPANRKGPGGGNTTSSSTPTFSDIPYASISSAQKLDLYRPTGDGPFPVILLVHGGAFLMGDKAAGDATTGIDQLLSLGYAVASINYRLSGEAKAPAQIQDIKAAVRFLRANAKDYKLNPEKFGAWGGSAGGSLVSLLGTSCGVKALEGPELGNSEQSSCVQAVVDWFGPIDFLQMDTQFEGTSCPINHNDADSPESQLVGGPIQENVEMVNLVNAITYVSSDDPPIFIQHGTADCNVPPQQSQLFYDSLVNVIGKEKVTLVFIEGAGHGGNQFTTESNLKLVTDFFDNYLK